MASYAVRLRGDIARWVESGLIDAATADALKRDVEARERRSFSFGSILAVLAAILLGAAILLFVGANWEAIPRLVRVAVLFAIIAAGYVGGALLKGRGHGAFGETSWLVGAAAFGGSIAMVGQMYHLSGDEAQAMLTWCAGTALAAIALRSGILTVAAVALADAWLVMLGFDFWSREDFPYWFLAIAAALWLVSYWTRSTIARHLLALSLVFYACLMAADSELFAISAALALVSSALFALAAVASAQVDRILQLDGRAPLHALIGFLAGMAMIQFEIADEGATIVIAAAIVFAGVAAALYLAGRDSRGLRWIAYLGFTFELCFLYLQTIGSMLGTAGFLLAVAVILGGLAFGIIRIERRMKSGPAETGAAS